MIGNDRDLVVSPQHAVLMMLSRREQVLVRAIHLARYWNGGVRQMRRPGGVHYRHLLLPEHAVLNAAGAALESMYPGRQALNALDGTAKTEIVVSVLQRALRSPLPGMSLGSLTQVYGPRAGRLLTGAEVKVAIREKRLHPFLTYGQAWATAA